MSYDRIPLFIKVHPIPPSVGAVYVNSEQILYIEPRTEGGSFITFNSSERYVTVKDTPEQIMQML